MKKLLFALLTISAAAPVRPSAAQAPAPILGTWVTEKKIKDAPAIVIVRADSSASYGTETVRWRLPAAGKLSLALGGEWVQYDYRIRNGKMTLSGGDLTEAIVLRRSGNATPRPATTPMPTDPDKDQ